MKLQVSTLVEGENRFHYDSTKDAWMRSLVEGLNTQGFKLESPLIVDLNLTKIDPDFYLRGKMLFDVEQTCARCAETFALKVKHPYEVALAKVPSVKFHSNELSEESEELDINFFEGNEIDLSPIMTEQFFLSIPYQSLCKSDCKGICQRCGTNLNTKDCECTEKSALHPFSVLQEINPFKQE